MLMPDTNVWIQLIKGRNPVLTARWRSLPADDIATCSIVKAELWHGAHKYENAAKRRAIVEFWLSPYESLPFDDVAASHYADIRHHLDIQRRGHRPQRSQDRRHLSSQWVHARHG
jgi:tRNA(fMet)-specific endonuclease VapC